MNNADPLLGIVVDTRYRIDARIARGGMASVYQAHDSRLDRDVAVKFIYPHLAEQADFAMRFIREARAAAALSSPYIVNVHDQGVAQTPQGNLPYLVMELVRGPNLRSELNRLGSLPLGFALELIRQTFHALKDAHAAGIAHRDVKPENILLDKPLDFSHTLTTPEVHVKVADFGLARAITEQSGAHTSMMLGTVAYAPPEMISNGTSGIAGDIYSAGIVFYETIRGALPFHGESPLAIAFEHVNKPVPRLSDDAAPWIPVAIDSLIAALTNRNPEARAANGSEALHMVNDVIGAIPPELMLRRIPVFPASEKAPSPTVQLSYNGDSAANASASSSEQYTNTTHAFDTHPTEVTANPAEATLHDDVQPVSLYPLPQQDTRVLTNEFARGGEFARGDDDTHITVYTSSMNTTHINAPTNHAAGDNENTVLAESDASTGQGTTAIVPNESVATKPHKKRSRALTVFVIVVLLIGVLIAAATIYWIKFAPVMPDVSGLAQTTAEAQLRDRGIAFETHSEYSDTVAQDGVIEANPQPGTKVLPWQIVELVISDGVEMWIVPDVVNLSADDAASTLEDVGFSIEKREEYSEDVQEGLVISQDPGANASVPHDSTVAFVVSLGREPLAVPDVVSQEAEQAKKNIEDLGLACEISEEFSDHVPKGAVISQDVAAGETRYRGDTIHLVVSKGPELIEVPNVFGKQRQDAINILEGAGFSVKVDEVLGGIFGTVRTQDPSGGTRVPPGTTVTITVV